MKAALAGVLFAWLCLLQGAYGVANLGPEIRDPANFLPPRILVGAKMTTSIKPSRPQTLERQAIASALPEWLNREPLGESESLNLYAYCHNDPINAVDVLGLAEHRFTIHDRATYLELFGSDAGTLLYDSFERRSDLYENLGLPGTISNGIGLDSIARKFLTGFSDQAEAGEVAANGIMWFETTKLSNQYSHLIGPWVNKTTFRHDAHTGEFVIGNGSLSRQSTGVLGSVYTVPVFRNYVDRHPIYWIATDTVAEHSVAIHSAAKTTELGRVAGLVTQISSIAPFGAMNRFSFGSSGIPYRPLTLPKSATRLSVDDKLARYLLNMEHPVGGDKARFFEKALGFTRNNADDLARQLVFDRAKAVQKEVTEFGVKFNQLILVTGANGRRIPIKVGWIQNNDGIVRIVTAVPGD